MHLCSSTDARLGYHFKQSTFITFSSCSSSASMLRWIPSSSHKTISLLFIRWVQMRKSFVASSWLAEITAYHSAQQCLAVCSVAMYLYQQATAFQTTFVKYKMWQRTVPVCLESHPYTAPCRTRWHQFHKIPKVCIKFGYWQSCAHTCTACPFKNLWELKFPAHKICAFW